MSGVRWKAVTAAVSTGTSAKTVLQVVAASNHALWIDEIGISFEGVDTVGTPIKVDICRQSTAGTSSALTPVKDPDDSDETLQITARHTATAEPTTGDIIMSEYVHPQSGYFWQAPLGRRIKVGGGDRLGVRVTAAASVNCLSYIIGEE